MTVEFDEQLDKALDVLAETLELASRYGIFVPDDVLTVTDEPKVGRLTIDCLHRQLKRLDEE